VFKRKIQIPDPLNKLRKKQANSPGMPGGGGYKGFDKIINKLFGQA
jgi:hypothetical protein